MTSFPFIIDLNKAVLAKSKGIQGRFHMSNKAGFEINTDTLGEVLKDAVDSMGANKYPLCLMMPPVGVSRYTEKNGEWDTYRFTIFFLKSSYYDSVNQVIAPNQMGTSQHSIPEDWHDMKRCAIDYLRILNELQRKKGLGSRLFRLEAADQVTTPISMIGVDRASGIRLDYKASLFIGCTIEDYADNVVDDIVIPVADSHPIHKL